MYYVVAMNGFYYVAWKSQDGYHPVSAYAHKADAQNDADSRNNQLSLPSMITPNWSAQ